ncbi:MAG: DUF4287 domain-containing protein [Planctomycetota bacterium]|nr:DUF4287 domain-containing protein [Planctomycetota bacterium]
MIKPTTKIKTANTAGISDEAVHAKTGKTWPQWIKTLDSHGAIKLTHKEIVAIVHDEYDIGPWWSQMVTVGYEQGKGLRDMHEKSGGFEVSVSKTITTPIDVAFKAFKNPRTRIRWLELPNGKGEFEIRKATTDKSMRITWVDCVTHLNINFWDKSEAKCQVVVQHTKLKTAKQTDNQKVYWKEQLAGLKSMLEKQ